MVAVRRDALGLRSNSTKPATIEFWLPNDDRLQVTENAQPGPVPLFEVVTPGRRPPSRRRATPGTVGRVKTLHTAYRVSDLAASLHFYGALGYGEVGRVDIGDGVTLAMLKFPGEQVVTLELVHRPASEPVDIGTGFSHLVVQADDLAAAIRALSRAGLRPGPVERPGGPDGPQTSWLTDPDGYRIELVQWPPGHPDGITVADFG
jgi:lactoylglutathione lyase